MSGDQLVPTPPYAAVSTMGSESRMRRIAEIHGARDNDGRCYECHRPFPCVTWQLATGRDQA